jgi:perosamine synthetase
MHIPLAKPDITDLEIEYVAEVLRTPNLSLGPKLIEFESIIAEYVGVQYAVATNSGTSALHLIVKGLGIGEDDEVITTPFSFIASANCLIFERARPVFVDIDPVTLNIDTNSIKRAITQKTRAILAVDIFGYPADWKALQQIASKNNLALIEDSCEALGAEYNGKKAGSFGDAGAFGFYPNKQITTGEGGVVVTNNKSLADLCSSMRNQGREDSDDWVDHQRLGYNFRLSDINCALGIAQLKRIKEILQKRENIAQIYNAKFADWPELQLPCDLSGIRRSWFVYVIVLDDRYAEGGRDLIISEMRKRDVACGRYFPPIHLQSLYKEMFGHSKGDFPITESISGRTIALPFYNNLTENEIDYVVQNLRIVLDSI